MKQETMTITTFFAKLKLLSDELTTINDLSYCGSEEAKQCIMMRGNKQKLFQFLLGLNETYSGVRRNLLMMQPLSSLNAAYSVLMQEEGQRSVACSIADGVLDPTTLHSIGSGFGRPGRGTRSGFRGTSTSRLNRDKTCSFCGKCKHRVELLAKEWCSGEHEENAG